VANHAAAIPSDAPVIMHGIEKELGRAVYGLADYFFRSLPVAGTLWSRGGGVTAHPDNAHRLLHDEGQLVLVFPEGVKGPSKLYKDRYQLRRFGRGGFVETAMRAGVPIVPIAVVGAEESMPILARSGTLARLLKVPYVPFTANMALLGPLGLFTYLPAKFKLRVLDPIHFDVPPGQERYARSRVMEESEAIRTQIQDALFDMLSRRRSVWFG
jgi:1-acyl-sn-glycerol-3-phosphate acyltransferase